MPSKK